MLVTSETIPLRRGDPPVHGAAAYVGQLII